MEQGPADMEEESDVTHTLLGSQRTSDTSQIHNAAPILLGESAPVQIPSMTRTISVPGEEGEATQSPHESLIPNNLTSLKVSPFNSTILHSSLQHQNSQPVDNFEQGGIEHENSDDSFHQTTQTVIVPMKSSQPKAGRFSVSPAVSIPTPLSRRLKFTSTTPTGSKGSLVSLTTSDRQTSDRPSIDQDIQFMMSVTSIAQGSDIQKDQSDETPFSTDRHNSIHRPGRSISQVQQLDTTPENIPLEEFDVILGEIDENQRTIQSGVSVNTQDSANYFHAPLQCGNIRFVKDAVDFVLEPKKHYMCVNMSTPVEQVSQFMARYWCLRNPKIVLSVISSPESFKPWKNQRLKDDFQKGIIKAANTTEMWIVTSGIDAGVPKIIGDAVKEYNIEQQSTHLLNSHVMSSSEKRRKRLTLIGIVPKETVPYGVFFDGTEGVQIKNVGIKPSADIYELNPEHTHFIMVEEDNKEQLNTAATMRCAIEKQFSYKTGDRKRKRLMSIDSETDQHHQQLRQEDINNQIPVVGLLVQGSPKNIDHVIFYLQNKMTVVVLKGSGGIADMLGYAYEEMHDKGEADPDYVENFLKPELIKMISKYYFSYFEDKELGRFTLRDKIIQCVKMSFDSDFEHSLMTVVNIKGWGSSMRNLDKYILQALFRSEKPDIQHLQDQLQNDLQLTIDWNRPDLAWDIFQRDLNRVRIDKKMFEQSLLQKDREEFIDLFLSQGVKVHKYLNHKKLKLLFEKAEDREFFINICLEGVIGITMLPDQPLGDCFLSENLNRLIYKLSWIRDFIQPYELSMSSTGLYIVDSTIAERKALNLLMIWAVLMNRHKLAKTLWNKMDEPIGVALICSRIYRELSKYRMEQYQRTELEDNATEFGKMALGALAICWRDSSVQAYNMLGKHLPDFNNKSVIEIAQDAGYIHFLAHPCCQRWLTNMFFGHLQVKELDWGVFRLPYWFKILVSAFFIFPMYIWISFLPPHKGKEGDGDEEEMPEYSDESESDADDDMPKLSKSAFDNSIKKRKIRNFSLRLKNALNLKRARDIPFHMKIYLLWTAPITKFWTTQMFYFMFLGVFSLAVLWPGCGNQYLDLVLWFWTVIIEMELVCRVYNKYHRYKTLSLLGNCIDISLIMVFIVLLLLTRILVWINIANYIQAKTIMCFGLIYFFYRLLGVYLPISPTLGPMLLRMNRMVKHDFVAFVRMFLIFMIVGGVTIQAVLYPNWPLNMTMIKRILTRPIYAMFLTQVQDLDGDPNCSYKYKYSNVTNYCVNTDSHITRPSGHAESEVMESLEECPYSSLSGYIITLQYLLICKLVLVTLLFAMFALTIGKVDKEASEIWKFQRYALIADFTERFSLPPPFTVLSFVYLFLKWIWHKLRRCCRRLWNCTARFCSDKTKKMPTNKNSVYRRKIDDTVFWKRVAREYMATEEAVKEKEEANNRHGEILTSLQDDLRSHKKSMKRLGDRVVELERMIQSSRLYLEDIAHKLEKSDVMGITNIKGRFIHVAARQSPYPGTSKTRFPVFDKYVPWEMAYDVYDPKTYTLAICKFPENEMELVDEDINELQRLREERLLLPEEDANLLTPIPEFKPKWNSVVSFKRSNEKCQIDRRSWITFDNKLLRYTIDALDLPQNPLGRTGIRGRGNLWRWGPNHVIKAVVTRWRRKYGADLTTTSDFLYVEGKRVLEFIATQKETAMDTSFCLPGDVLHGLSNPYSILVKAFMSSLVEDVDLNLYNSVDQAEMIQLFGQFASGVVGGTSVTSITRTPLAVPTQPSKTDTDPLGFSATLLYKGYLDDPRNTDNAWVEAEVWNFHYDIGDSFDYSIQEESSVKWKEVSPYVKMFGNESVIVQEAARIHDAYN